MSTRIICLGNAQPKAYKENPNPPKGASAAILEIFATEICGLDISGIPAVGETVYAKPTSTHPKPAALYKTTKAHREANLRALIEEPVEIPWLGGKCRTKIRVSPDSNLVQAVGEIQRIWNRSGNGTPGWIAGTDPILVEAVKQELGITEVREYVEDDK